MNTRALPLQPSGPRGFMGAAAGAGPISSRAALAINWTPDAVVPVGLGAAEFRSDLGRLLRILDVTRRVGETIRFVGINIV